MQVKHCYYTSRNGSRLHLKSRLELAACLQLDVGGIAYRYEPKRFHLDGSSYKIDLELIDLQVYVEIKCLRDLEAGIQRIDKFKSVIDLPVVVWTEADLKEGKALCPDYEFGDEVLFNQLSVKKAS